MLVKGVKDEDFVNYRIPSMFISTARCSFKCDRECGMSCCQNSSLAKSPDIDIDPAMLARRYIDNPITRAIVFAGLEPMDQFEEVIQFINIIRNEFNCNDDIVIYSGYYKNEIDHLVSRLKEYKNIIIKYGRFIPNSHSTFDAVLGIKLASSNQYAERIS